jgi:hypothetical protein
MRDKIGAMKHWILFMAIPSFLLSACTPEDPRYRMVRSAIDQLIEVRDSDALYLRFIYHGQPPVDPLDPMVLLRYSYTDQENVIQATFAYFSNDLFYEGSRANDLYSYRSQYSQLSAAKMNEEYGFTL